MHVSSLLVNSLHYFSSSVFRLPDDAQTAMDVARISHTKEMFWQKFKVVFTKALQVIPRYVYTAKNIYFVLFLGGQWPYNYILSSAYVFIICVNSIAHWIIIIAWLI